MTDKYKMFRNYMTNELGISRDDIKLWTKDAVREVAEKIVGQLDVEGIVRGAINRSVNSVSHHVEKEIAREIADRLSVRITLNKGSSKATYEVK